MIRTLYFVYLIQLLQVDGHFSFIINVEKTTICFKVGLHLPVWNIMQVTLEWTYEQSWHSIHLFIYFKILLGVWKWSMRQSLLSDSEHSLCLFWDADATVETWLMILPHGCANSLHNFSNTHSISLTDLSLPMRLIISSTSTKSQCFGASKRKLYWNVSSSNYIDGLV